MAKTNRICFLCGKHYRYCPTCSPDINKPSWYVMWCSEQCKDLDQILAAHTMKHITTEEAKEKIELLKLNEINFEDKDVKRHYDEIMSYTSDEKVESSKETKEDNNTDKAKVTQRSKISNTKTQVNKNK